MNKIIWGLKQLFPLMYYSQYTEGKEKIIVIWNMWFSKCYNIKKWVLK